MKPPLHKIMYYTTHRVKTFDPSIWEQYNDQTEQWESVTYDEVPDAIWSQHETSNGWRFYTDRKHIYMDADGNRHARTS